MNPSPRLIRFGIDGSGWQTLFSLRVAESARTGALFYPWRDAMQDHCLYLKIQEALRSGAAVAVWPQPFSQF